MRQIEIQALRRQIRGEIGCIAGRELAGIREFLKTYPHPMGAAFRNAPWDDEPATEEEIRLVEEAREWLRQNGGRGIPHEQIMRELGIE